MASWARTARKRNPEPVEDRTVPDPRGCEITVRARRWRKHAVKRHHELKGFYEQVMETISAPDFITQSTERTDRVLYYRRVANPPSAAKPLLAVVAEIDYEGSGGHFVTAYFEAEKPEKERIVWTP